MIVRVVVPGRPAPKGSWIPTGRSGRGVRPDNPRSVPWAHAVTWAAKVAMAGRRPFRELPLVLSAVFALPADGSKWSHPIGARTGDLDKLVRNCGDALQEIVFDNDSRIVKFGEVVKVYAVRTPGAVITLRPWRDSDQPEPCQEVG